MARDLGRNIAYFGVNLKIPSNFPILTLKAQRLLTAAQYDQPQQLEALSRRLWQIYWDEDGDVTQDATLIGACKRIGLDDTTAQALLARTEDPAIKEALKATTAEAVSRGAFGAPTFFVHTTDGVEMFFGSDRFPVVAKVLGVEWHGPVPPTD
jgi:glutathione S-transferase kappa 1